MAASPYVLIDHVLYFLDGELHRLAIPDTTWENPTGTPTTLKRFLLATFHSSGLLGHPGRARTYNLLVVRYYWDRLHSDVDRWVRDCILRTRCKALVHTDVSLLGVRLVARFLAWTWWAHGHPRQRGATTYSPSLTSSRIGCGSFPSKGRRPGQLRTISSDRSSLVLVVPVLGKVIAGVSS